MNKKIYLTIFLIIIFFTFTFFLFKPSSNIEFYNDSGSYSGDGSETLNLLGTSDYGKVYLLGKFGNQNSKTKIAIITGVHPLENNAHETFIRAIETDKNLKYSYHVYKVDVSKNPYDYNEGRIYGQLLAQEFLVPEIKKGNYDLAVDIHSNEGNGEYGLHKFFIFTPIDDNESLKIADFLIEETPNLEYFSPESQTSPAYVTIPIIRSGTPAIVYEVYLNTNQDIHEEQAKSFLKALESIDFNK